MATYNQITIRPLCASLQHDTDLFGKMDPYCLVTLGTQQWKSEISKKGDKTPCWNDEVVFVVQQGVDLLRIALFDDKLIGQDKLIAEGVIPMEKLLNFASPFEEKIPLTYKAKPCGYIQLRFTFGNAPTMMNQGAIGQNLNTNFQQYPTQNQQYNQTSTYAQPIPQSNVQQHQHHNLLHHDKQNQQYAQNQQFQGQQLTGQQLTSQSIPYQQQNVQIPVQQQNQQYNQNQQYPSSSSSSQVPQTSYTSASYTQQTSTVPANQIPPLQQQPGAVGSNDYYHHQHHHTFNKQ